MKNSQSHRFAVIDLGSNTARLIVMNAIPGYAYRLADEIREVMRLRRGMTDFRSLAASRITLTSIAVSDIIYTSSKSRLPLHVFHRAMCHRS